MLSRNNQKKKSWIGVNIVRVIGRFLYSSIMWKKFLFFCLIDMEMEYFDVESTRYNINEYLVIEI